MLAEERLRIALLLGGNRHWLTRITLGLWALHIPIIGFLAPETVVGRALEQAGVPGFVFMFALAVLAGIALVDGALNGLCPSVYTICMMAQRHVGFMLLGTALVIAGGGITHATRAPPVVLLSFLIPAALCVAVTWLDLFGRRKEQRR
jgi:hypothetical protein